MQKHEAVRSILVLVFTIIWSTSIYGEVTDSTAAGFTVKHTLTIAGLPGDVYRNLVDHVGRWWDPNHTFSGDSRNLYIEEKGNGCFCEQLPDGGSARHMVVVFSDPGKTLRMVGGLGPLQAMAATGSLTWSLTAEESSTRVELTYAVGGYRPGGLQKLAVPVDRVLLQQLKRLKNYVEEGKPEGE